LTIWKKAVSVGTSAALLASLLAATVAPAAFASISQTSAGNVAQGSTSAGTATFLFTENSVAALTTLGHMTVTITPAAPGAGTVSWAGTPVVSAPDSLGVILTFPALNVLDIRIRGFDNANVETISITGLKVKASANASPGAVVATLGDDAAGAIYGAFVGGTVTATGKLAQAYGVGTTSFIVANDVGSCPFAGANNVTVGSEVLTGIAVSAINTPVAGQQTITSTASTASHLANEVVSQTVPNCATTALGAPATVVTAAAFTYAGTPTVYPGENNGVAADLYLDEPATPVGFLAKNTVLTYTIATAGVVFSGVPSVMDNDATMVLSMPTLSADRKVVTVTVTTASAAAARVTLYNIHYDVASTVTGGTYVEVNLTLSGALLVTGNPATNAIVFRGINASAPTPTVYIGENNQATGLVTLAEQAAGFFNAGLGANNTLAVCTTAVNYSFTFAPWAKVTAGDLKLREGTTVSPDNIVEGVWNGGSCYTWTVWTASTVASTIVIGNSTFATGPLINVAVNQAPGMVSMNVYSGNQYNYDQTRIATVGFAVAAFRNQVAVTALSQPLIPAGAVSKTGAIQIAETANGQLKRWEAICVEILPRGSLDSATSKYDTFIHALTTAQLPVVTATGGLVISPVELSDSDCFGRQVNGFGPTASGTHTMSFNFDVLQQSTAGNGKLVIDNVNVITLADAASGPVLFNVYGFGISNTAVDFQATVSPAKIGAKAKLSIGAVSALGNNPTSGYSTSTPKVQAAGKYITWKFTGGSALANQRVNILVAKRVNGAWGGPQYFVSRTADANGIVTFVWKGSAGLVANARAQWPGNANYAVSTSKALGAHWQ